MRWALSWLAFGIGRSIDERAPDLARILFEKAAAGVQLQPGRRSERLWAAAKLAAAIAVAERDPGASLRLNELVAARLDNTSDPINREHLAWAIVNRGWDLATLKRYTEALANYDEFARRFEFVTAPKAVAQGLMNRAIILDHLGLNADVRRAYEGLVTLEQQDARADSADLFAWARVNLGVLMARERRLKEANAQYTAVISQNRRPRGRSATRRLELAAISAYRHRAEALIAEGHYGEAIKDAEAVSKKRLGAHVEQQAADDIAWAALARGVSLERLGRTAEAVDAYDSVIKRWAAVKVDDVSQAVLSARRMIEALKLAGTE